MPGLVLNGISAGNVRVAMVVRHFSTSGGLELYAHKVVEGLLNLGFDVTVICEENQSRLSAENLKVVEFSGVKGSKRKQLTQVFEAATRAVAQSGPFDIVHSQHCPVVGANVATFHNHTVARLSRIGARAEAVLNDFKRSFIPAYKMRQHHDEELCRHARCLIFPAKIMQKDFYTTFDFLENNNVPYVVANPGADLAKNEAGSPGGHSADPDRTEQFHSHSNNEPFSFLFVGRGFRKKGLDVLLAACKILRERKRNFVLNIAGLKLKPIDKIRLDVLGLSGTVNYLGFCRDMNAVYARSEVLILPSRLEPFGMAPIQAMQHGLVPIVSKLAGVAEVLTDGHDALLLNENLSACELANLMEQLIDQPLLLGKLKANAARTAAEVSWENTVRETVKAYEIVLTASRSKADSGSQLVRAPGSV